jgi:tRNA wybutosine-synthesizing protein 1
MTTFVPEHPGGSHFILARAGRDATDDFEANEHSQRARTLLVDHFKGRLSAASSSTSTKAASATAPTVPESLQSTSRRALKVFYATQKGTARRYAEQIASEAIACGAVSSATAVDLKSYEPEDLASETAILIFVMSTYSEGQPTDSGKFFCSWLEDACTDFRVQTGFLSRLNYTVFGLGNSIYEENFNKVALTVDNWLQVGGAQRFFECGVGDENIARSDTHGTQEKDLQAWLLKGLPVLSAVASASVDSTGGAAKSGCCSENGCSCKTAVVSAEHEADVRQDLESDEVESGGPLARSEPLVDLEDMGPMMSAARPAGTRRIKKAAAAAAAAEAAVEADDEEEDSVPSASQPLREMVTDEIRQSLTKQGYKIIGSHSGVKLCRWTKAMLRGRGGCYKHTCYGIKSYSCMEMTPSLACANKCVFCWRHHSNPVGKEWKWQLDEPDFLIEQAMANHAAMIRQMKGVPGVKPERLADAATIQHCALSLVGEPIMYPHINRFIDLLHERHISTFLVTNAQFPDRIRDLKPVTQLYVSVDAATPESLKAVDRPLFKDYWERFLASLEEIGKKQTRTVYRLTLIKAWNMEEIANYASLITRGLPEFIEIKGVTFCGSSDASNLTMKNVPFHHEVQYFAQELLKYISDDYELACEHAHSCMIVIAHKKFRIDGVWYSAILFIILLISSHVPVFEFRHTWIDYEKFHQLANSGRPFTSV